MSVRKPWKIQPRTLMNLSSDNFVMEKPPTVYINSMLRNSFHHRCLKTAFRRTWTPNHRSTDQRRPTHRPPHQRSHPRNGNYQYPKRISAIIGPISKMYIGCNWTNIQNGYWWKWVVIGPISKTDIGRKIPISQKDIRNIKKSKIKQSK